MPRTKKNPEAKAEKNMKGTDGKAKAAMKATAKKFDDKKTAEQNEAKKLAANAKAAKMKIVIQSPMGGIITPEEIAAKLPKGAKQVYVRVDQNKLWWINGEETGSVDIW